MCLDLMIWCSKCFEHATKDSVFHHFHLSISLSIYSFFQLIQSVPPAISLFSPGVSTSLRVGAGPVMDTGRDKPTFYLPHLIFNRWRLICEHIGTYYVKIFFKDERESFCWYFLGRVLCKSQANALLAEAVSGCFSFPFSWESTKSKCFFHPP